ncbi:MAG: chromosomal replication initiator protein DnaA [Victivallaceae bacterium]|nr:chromosomal replication initiator protein DnaA [Victivallaceae bacterium]
MEQTELAVDLLWEKACISLREKTRKSTFEQWFSGIVPIALNEEKVVLGVSDDFFGQWLDDNFSDLMTEAVNEAGGQEYVITFESGHIKKITETELAEAESEPENVSTRTVVANSNKPKHRVENSEAGNIGNNVKFGSSLLSRHTFDNFVVGEANRYAFTVAQTAAVDPGCYNPLYIYGSTGTGKTHLLQAVSNHIMTSHPHARVLYITCEEFLNSYVDSLRNKSHDKFRRSVRNADVLLVDDVHMLAGKTQLQEEFFNTFNKLYHEEKQIILTSDKQPFEIKGLEERLVSRFESGVTSEITPPDIETRLAILKMMQEEHLIKINDEVLFFVASRISCSIRRLKGALMRLVAYSSAMSKCRITIEDAERLLHRLFDEENANKIITIENIQKTVAEHFDLKITDILSSKRPKNIAEPRMVAMYLSRQLTDNSFPDIGRAFDRNHATIMNALKKIPLLCSKNESLRRSVSKLQHQLAN